jgi:hypothetical protein
MRTSITVGQVLRSKGQEFVCYLMTAYKALKSWRPRTCGALLAVEGKLMEYSPNAIMPGRSS